MLITPLKTKMKYRRVNTDNVIPFKFGSKLIYSNTKANNTEVNANSLCRTNVVKRIQHNMQV